LRYSDVSIWANDNPLNSSTYSKQAPNSRPYLLSIRLWPSYWWKAQSMGTWS
jgi:hypothetical protein